MRPVDYATHSAYSDPGPWSALLDDLPTDRAALSAVARNVIGHYRVHADELPDETRDEVNLRWLADILAADQSRNAGLLTKERKLRDRVQGCCRDHTLFCVGALRQHGIAARSRIGFATYFHPDWNHDHVIVEARLDGRWVRFDSELHPGEFAFDTLDIPAGPEAPFRTAAEVWQGHRAGQLDVETFGVDLGSPIRGEWFVRSYVFAELAHRMKDELLLWDGWGLMGRPEGGEGADELADGIAALLVAADAHDKSAERELVERYREEPLLHPGEEVQSFSPTTGELTQVALVR